MQKDIKQLESATKSDFELVRKDTEHLVTKDELNDFKVEFKDELNSFKVEIYKLMNTQLKWIIGTGITVGSLLFAALKFFG